jgi:hypothetical protein
MPLEGVPVASELVTAALALVTGYGLIRVRKWALPLGLILSGMWCYGVIAGINLVILHGLDFSSPFGAISDAILFPLVLAFSLFMATFLWRNRKWFQ